ncbi:hypothetical protein F0562_017122 [Nyssa sinensis]|uniref:Integrase catalytic domain-containing protein n=1 Tax=Nyssa sinensis TaxID=561372 RepID=A0A5J4ZEY4_9ASTE|nr:hypothetical protein F0562_017122 [Nyssa sinensis]
MSQSVSNLDSIVRPIDIILDGSNYSMWAQNMEVFLKGRRLWRYVTGDLATPTQKASETEEAFSTRLEEWGSMHYKILSWFINTSVPSINSLLPRLGNAKDTGQSIADFYSQTNHLWEQLSAADPKLACAQDIQTFAAWLDRRKFMHFMMALRDDFESTRASLLHRQPLPTLDAAVSELISEETRRSTMKMQSSDMVLATASRGPSPSSTGRPSSQSNSPIRLCQWCNFRGHTIDECRKYKSYQRRQASRQTATVSSSTPAHQTAALASSTSSAPESSSPSTPLTAADVTALIHQVLSQSSTALSVTPGKSQWFIDSACCNHMTSDSTIFSHKTALSPNPAIYIANGSHMPVSHVGSISTSNLSVSDTYLVPQLSLNLLSVGQLCELGLDLKFSNKGVDVQDSRMGQLLGTGRKVGRLFELTSLQIPSSTNTSRAAITVTSSLWHSRLGHASLPRVQFLASQGHIGPVKFQSFDCVSCHLGKQTHLSFNKSASFFAAPFDLVHSDIWGPAPTPTEGGSRYFVIFVDDYNRYTWIYLLQHRSELTIVYQNFHKMVQTQFSCTIKTFRSDNAMEYKDKSFLALLQHNGTISHHSCPYTSQQNGRAERKHRHILDTVRALLISASIPERFWGEAALTAVYTINRVPSPTIQNKTPFELLHGTVPNYSLLRVFGCVCFVTLPSHERTKLEPRSRLCCLLGYGLTQKGYRCYDPIAKRLRISRHVEFWEHKMFTSISPFPQSSISYAPIFTDPSIALFPDSSAEMPSSSDVPSSPVSESSDTSADTLDPSTTSEPIQVPALRQSTRVRAHPSHLQDFHCYYALATLHEPHSYREASADPLWQKAMSDELEALTKTHTWDLVDLPPGKSAVGCKWVYKIKTRSDGSVERYKARLVAKGFSQEYGIDYEETFAPVARLTSVRSLLAIAAVRHWQLFQMDVKNALLNGDLAEEVYMHPPPGYAYPPHTVFRLRRALYDLKQAPRAWFAKFSCVVAQQGFTPSAYDSALFFRTTGAGIILILLYVDDMIITGDDLSGIRDLQHFLSQNFEMKDLGQLNYFLGLEVTFGSDGYYLSQAKYASDLLSKAGLTDSKTCTSPLDPNVRLLVTNGESLPDATLYRQLVGSLIYLTVTRPDISYAVHLVSQFMSAPRSTHYAAVLHILRYVKGTLFHGLHFSSRSSLELRSYSDADWAGDPTDRRFTTGYCFLLGTSLISWRSKKQTIVARSSTEAEYRALADTTAELL